MAQNPRLEERGLHAQHTIYKPPLRYSDINFYIIDYAHIIQ